MTPFRLQKLYKLAAIILGLLMWQPSFSHYKARYHVIVDTDGGMDDLLAICMMLASPEIEVIAITAVDGILPPQETAFRLTGLLRQFGHEGIPVGTGSSGHSRPDAGTGQHRLAEKIRWGENDPGNGAFPEAAALMVESIDLEEMPVDIVAMGPLTNLTDALQVSHLFPERVRNVYWHNDPNATEDINMQMDPAAASVILNSRCALNRIHSEGATIGDLTRFREGIDTLQTRYAEAVARIFSRSEQEKGLSILLPEPGDACLPLFMLCPEMFIVEMNEYDPFRLQAALRPVPCTGGEAEEPVAEKIGEILASDREDRSIVFERFPSDPSLFAHDVSELSGRLLHAHGPKEWKIIVLTNEFHEHLGIYSILGAKMGLRAREYFHVGIDELLVTSHAGSTPPVSCLNDGLQVSTGATLGHGTITLSGEEVVPSARFAFKNREVELTVRQVVLDRIRMEVSRGVRIHGPETPDYWQYIRDLALKYWLELDRREIFEIRECSPASEDLTFSPRY